MKKFLSLVVAALLMVSAVATSATAAKFTDIDATNTALNEAVDLLVTLGVTKGTTDTTFGADENVTRQQMAAFLYRMMKGGKAEPANSVNYTKFTDLVDPYYNYVITWASQEGIIKGRDAQNTIFDPNGGIILQDAYTMMVRALGYDDGSFVYPVDYIEKAEELGLDKAIPSTVDYTAALKRGDVAIIVANMFYAKTAKVDVSYVWDDVENTLKLDEKQKTLAEVAFGILPYTYRVMSTTNFGGISEKQQDAKKVNLMAVKEDGTLAADSDFDEIEFSELGLPGKADDYFLSDISVFIKNKGDKTKQEIIGAAGKGTLKTVDFSKVAVGTTVKVEDEEEVTYLTGKMTVDGVEVDIEDVTLLTPKTADAWGKNKASNTYVDFTETSLTGLTFEKAFNATNFTTGYTELNYFVVGAHGEVDVYDSDSDGKAEYLFVKPYSVVKLDNETTTTEGKELKAFENLETPIYTQTAILSGEAFENEDLVLAYVNADARYIKVAKVLEATTLTIKSKDSKSFTFSNDVKIEYEKLEGMLVNGATILPTAEKSLATTATVGGKTALVEYDAYFVDGKLVYAVAADGDDKGATDVKTNWAIILNNEDETVYVPNADGSFSTEGETRYYLNVYLDGKVQKVKVTKAVHDAAVMNKLTTLDKVDKKGNYSFKAAIEATDENKLNGTEYTELLVNAGDDIKIEKNDKGYIEITDMVTDIKGAEAKFNGLKALEGAQFIIRSKTEKLDEDGKVVKDEETGETVYVPVVTVYTADTLPAMFAEDGEANLDSVLYLVANDTKSKLYENLVVFYGIYDGDLGKAGSADKYAYVVDSSTSPVEDEDGEVSELVTYSAFAEGAVKDIASAADADDTKAVFGDIYEIDTEGKLMDEDDLGADLKYGNLIDWADGTTEIPSGEGHNFFAIVIEAFDLDAKRVEADKEYTLKADTVYVKVDEKEQTITAGSTADIKVLESDDEEELKELLDTNKVIIRTARDSAQDITYITEMIFVTLEPAEEEAE